MRDRVQYALPLGVLGRLAHRLSVKRDVESIFNFREEAMQRLFQERSGVEAM
jgi:ligand-binding SRPBCC domain-containing protein